MNNSFKFRSPEFGEFRFKQNDGTRNFRKHSIDRVINNLSVCSLATLKSEVDTGIRLHAHIRATTETIEGYPSEYCAVFYLGIADSFNRDLGWQRNFKQSISGISGDTDFFDITNEGNNLDKPMFVGVINISEKGQCSIPCLIRLQALNSCPLNIAQSFDVSSGAFVVESDRTITDGEVNIPIESRVFEEPKLPDQKVECGTQVVAGISDEQRKLGRDVFKLLKPEHALSCITISYKLINDSVGLTIQEPLHQVIYDLEMLICPAEFEKRAIKWMHIKTIQQNKRIV